VVIDRLPNETNSKALAMKHHEWVWRLTSGNNIPDRLKYPGSKEGETRPDSWQEMLVHENRTFAIDYLMERLRLGMIRFPTDPDAAPWVQQVFEHVKNIEKVDTEEAGRQRAEYRWQKTGPDHFLHAFFYLFY
jgi:hypothetical protein